MRVETNIKTEEDKQKLLRAIYDWYVSLRYPGYRIKEFKQVKEVTQHGEVV